MEGRTYLHSPLDSLLVFQGRAKPIPAKEDNISISAREREREGDKREEKNALVLKHVEVYTLSMTIQARKVWHFPRLLSPKISTELLVRLFIIDTSPFHYQCWFSQREFRLSTAERRRRREGKGRTYSSFPSVLYSTLEVLTKLVHSSLPIS